MSLVTDSPVNSSSSDDFAALLDAELDSSSSEPSPDQEVEDDFDHEIERIKRRKLELDSSDEPQGSTPMNLEASIEKDICSHPGVFRGLCIRCGQKMDDGSGVAFGYIHKDLRLGNDEIVRLRTTDLKNLLRRRKLYLVLDLDHTLLNSTRLVEMTPEERHLSSQENPLQGGFFKLDSMHMMTKLRPFVHTFLKEASNMFEMSIYTMAERPYALEMAKLLDPEGLYFSSRVISQADSTQRHQKGLDVVLGQESAVLILDDTEHVLKIVRAEILKGCKLVFSRVFPTKFQADNHHLWKIAEQLGATCLTELDPSVTHVISADAGTEKSRWAVREKKFLVNKRWIEAANYLWRRQPEENFPVS
ncbi:RNA polymerase II C-terminal domain phosphatase-like 4 isoform X3 [Malania oleifera]|uniref:RNA polymerase II C-terminal domain phosphatase-like 4 isoform X3 n=1 Tax=Malania oleifera TaxID=397392 RepID=UPI0025ADEBA8|nr:RNA polymerase II C-terminal domain phosphatase-like 4 isoform X3 [Malania oleifera]